MEEENLKIEETDTYKEIKEKLLKHKNGIYKDYIIEENDITLKYAIPIFDVENREKNKPLDAISYTENLGKTYIDTCKWLLRNTSYYPGLLNTEIKLFAIIERLKFALMLTPKEDYIVPFDMVYNKEDDVLQAITLKYSNNKILFSTSYLALDYYFDIEKQSELLIDKNEKFIENLTYITI